MVAYKIFFSYDNVDGLMLLLFYDNRNYLVDYPLDLSIMVTEASERITIEQFLKGHTHSLIVNDKKI